MLVTVHNIDNANKGVHINPEMLQMAWQDSKGTYNFMLAKSDLWFVTDKDSYDRIVAWMEWVR